MKTFEFLKIALKNYKRVGALATSSRFTIQRVLRELKGSRFVIEYGGGTGVMTRAILNFLPPDGKLIVIEINKEFLKELRSIRDDRLTIIEGNAVGLSECIGSLGISTIDAVVSSIPLSLMSATDREAIIKNTRNALQPGGIFIIYHQYSLWTVPMLKKWFRRVKIEFEPLNFFPCFIIRGEK